MTTTQTSAKTLRTSILAAAAALAGLAGVSSANALPFPFPFPVNLPPVASFTATPNPVAVGNNAVFNGSASTAGQGHTIASYRWSFGDGNTDSGATVSHSYVAAGTYSVQLTVTDESGQSVTSSATTVIVGSGTSGPTAVFTYSPPSPVTPGTTVTFDATPSTNTPAGTAPVIFQWQFECSAPSIAPACTDADVVTTTTSPTIRHTYSLAGKFSVKLTEFDTAGRSNSTSRLITVQ